MTDETLRELLARVHERLSSSKSIDPESRDMLATLIRDLVDKDAASTTPPTPRLEAMAVRFESDHPALAQLLRQIGALLGQAGI